MRRRLLIATLFLAACSPAPSPSPATSSQESPTAAQHQYAIDWSPGVRFDYPVAWWIITENIEARHYQWIPVVLGTGDWKLNCTTYPATSGSGGSISCGADIFMVAPGQVVVEMYTLKGPEPFPHTAPPTAILLANGWRAVVQDEPASSLWQVYVPDWIYPLTLDAHFANPGAENARTAVRRLIASMRLSSSSLASPSGASR